MMRAALFIDAANVFYSQKTMGWNVDFAKVYEYFDKHFALYNAFYYSAEPQDTEEEKQKEYQQFSLQGITMRMKPLKEIRDSRGRIVLKKANLDIEMVVDMFATQQNYDIAILFTGDSDFTRAIELLRMNGKQIFVLSTKGHSGLELINASDKFMDLQSLRTVFEKEAEPEAEPQKTVKKAVIKKVPAKKTPTKTLTKKPAKIPVHNHPVKKTVTKPKSILSVSTEPVKEESNTVIKKTKPVAKKIAKPAKIPVHNHPKKTPVKK